MSETASGVSDAGVAAEVWWCWEAKRGLHPPHSTRLACSKTPVPDLHVGDRLKMTGGPTGRWWTVAAADDRWAVLTVPTPFKAGSPLSYTIIDRRIGSRGPCNLIGQGWDVETPGGCDALLTDLRSGEVEISSRNNVSVEVLERRAAEVSR